jgi:hypothetical protein
MATGSRTETYGQRHRDQRQLRGNYSLSNAVTTARAVDCALAGF